jgi:hypothetical protein
MIPSEFPNLKRIDLINGAKLDRSMQHALPVDRIIGEFDSERIRERVDLLNPALCRADLERFIPGEVYRALEESGFKPLRDAVSKIFADWL